MRCAALQQFAESAVATQVTTQQLGDGEIDILKNLYFIYKCLEIIDYFDLNYFWTT